MTKKKSFVLRLNPDMFKKLEKWAVDEFRSTNGQIEWILNKALKDAGRLKENDTDLTNDTISNKNEP